MYTPVSPTLNANTSIAKMKPMMRKNSIKFIKHKLESIIVNNNNSGKQQRNHFSKTQLTNEIDAGGIRLTLNIAGKRFEVFEHILTRYPQSLLGNKSQLLDHYDPFRNEYFFDRNRLAFEGILFFYQTGRFELPEFVTDDVFYYELKYFGLDNLLNSEANCENSILYTAIDEEYKELKKIRINRENRETIRYI